MTHEITEQLRKDLEWIVGERHHHSSPEHLAAVADRLERELAVLGCRTSRQSFGNQGVTGQNIIGELSGSEEVVLLTAHYDSVIGSPGADDNGSAVAGMLACARALAGGSGGRTLRFLGFDMEETQPNGHGLIGSHAYARETAHERILAVLNFEMIGYCRHEPGSQRVPDGFEQLFPEVVGMLAERGWVGNFLAAVGNPAGQELLARFAGSAGALPVVPLVAPDDLARTPDLLRSDHTAFWRRGVPALMLTDTSNFRNPHYHGAGDTIETLDLQFTSQVVQAAIKTIESLR